MRYVDEYRNEADAQKLLHAIERSVTRDWVIMEICGGQTHTLIKSGIDRMLPEAVTLVHGPGCPVCVTPLEMIDKAIAIARRPEVIFASFGDMLRVPGSGADLLSVKATGGDVRMVYSPLDAVKLAQARPDREVVFFAVGFETTAPANAMAVLQAREEGLANFTIGQRKGIGLSSPEPLYVVAKNPPENSLTVGPRDALERTTFSVANVHWVSGEVAATPVRAMVRVRYKAREVWGTVLPAPAGKATVSLDEPLPDITPGQAAVFYDGEVCLGNGVITA